MDRIPQLGGDESNLADYLKELKIQDGDELVEFYHRAKAIEYEIRLQRYQTGQTQRLMKVFLKQLQLIPSYK